jgi:Holliday junction resolvase
MPSNSSKDELVSSLNSLGIEVVAGKVRRSDIKKALAGQTSAMLIPIGDVIQVLDIVHYAFEHKKRITARAIDQYLKKHSIGDLHKFALSVLHYFQVGIQGKSAEGKYRKIVWKDLDMLEDQINPGFDIIPLSFMKRNLDLTDPKVARQLPPPVMNVMLQANI